jgi:hypothetical protein
MKLTILSSQQRHICWFTHNVPPPQSLIIINAQVGILILTILGVIIPLLMADPDKMIRTDGTRVVMTRHPSWKSEFYSLWVAITTDPMVLLLFPMFFASNYFYTWRASPNPTYCFRV